MTRVGQPAMRSWCRRLADTFRHTMYAAPLVLGGAWGCGDSHAAGVDSPAADSIALVRQDSITRAQPGYVVDSILPMEEQLRRFRKGLDTVRYLAGAESSLEGVITRLIASLVRNDTASLVRLAISRAEYAWLTFPDSPLSAEPYRHSPDIAWLMHAAGNRSGLARLLNRYGGKPVVVNGWRCTEQPAVEGKNRVWTDCDVTFTINGSVRTLQLFSSVIERDARFKILSYNNAF